MKHQDYHGKRIFVKITDHTGDFIDSKIDFGVHKNLSIEQEEYCFEIACYDEGANLLINSKEQMFTEKLRSLLKFGTYSTRYKDIFDMCWLSDLVDTEKLVSCLNTIILSNHDVKENTMQDIQNRINKIFASEQYLSRLSSSKKNWLNLEIPVILSKLTAFLKSLQAKKMTASEYTCSFSSFFT